MKNIRISLSRLLLFPGLFISQLPAVSCQLPVWMLSWTSSWTPGLATDSWHLATHLAMSASQPAEPDPITLFQQVSDRLAALKTIKYRYLRELSYPAENYHAKNEGDMYIDYSASNKTAGFRYQYHDERGFGIFNDSEVFAGNSKDKTLRVQSRVTLANLEGRSPLYNSIPTLRNILPLIIKDTSIPKTAGDTLINGQSYHLLNFILQNKTMNYTGTGFSPTTLPLTFYHKLIVDKTTGLPLTLLQTKKGSQDLNRTDFQKIDTRPAAPVETSWYYSSYLTEYKIADDKPLTIIAPGQTAPDWELTNYSTNTKETFAKYKGKVVLLEFWIRHCGYCIEAVSNLNKLYDKYNSDKFKLLAINTEATRENIDQFNRAHPMKYSVMYGDNGEVEKSYGVAAYPQVVLVGRDGKVLYSGGIDVEKIGGLIENEVRGER